MTGFAHLIASAAFLASAILPATAAEPDASLARTAEAVRSVARQIDRMEASHATMGEIARSTQRMINGVANSAGIDEGWVASVFDADGFACGAAIIGYRETDGKRISFFGENDTYSIVTAAHCFGKDATILDAAGSSLAEHCDLIHPRGFKFGIGFRMLEEQQANAFEAVQICRHKGYTDTTLQDDIAVIEIPRPEPELKRKVSAIAIAMPDEDLLFADRARISALGWGPSSIKTHSRPEKALLRIDLPISTEARCPRQANADGIEPVTENTICAGFETGGTGVCYGDSGSPAVFLPMPGESEFLGGETIVSHPILMGITSYSARCGINGVDSFFVDIRAYRDWIERVTRAFTQTED